MEASSETSIERYHILHLESGELTEITLCDQTYPPDKLTQLLKQVDFRVAKVYPAWAGLPLYDAEEWLVYLAER